MKRHDILFQISAEQRQTLEGEGTLTCSAPRNLGLSMEDEFTMVNGTRDTVDEHGCAVLMTHITEHTDRRKRSKVLCTVKRISEFAPIN